MRRPITPETTLYAPVKRYLERLGFTVKGEVCGCDLVALRGEEPPIVVIGELKSAFSLELVLQGVNRTAACDEVWLAVRVTGRGAECAIRVCTSFAVSWALVCLGYHPPGRSKCLLSRNPGGPVRTQSAAHGWFKNIEAGLVIPLSGDRPRCQS